MVKYFNMEHSNQLTQGLNEIKTVANNGSWFRDTPHYWAEASLPLAYAVACAEVVSKSSEKPATHLVDAAIKMGARIVSVKAR